ncbi:YeeE/YedE family protein [Myxococcota bacterium]|nr:YeeE/YedE family protein [Myxococcota bacterium]
MALASFGAGLLFAVGLGVSGMTQAPKVIGFLNLPGDWDPSLALVMVGAIAVHLVLFRLILRRGTPLWGGRFGVPTRADVDARLLGGAALFGVGWALGGYCPGPGLVSVVGGGAHAWTFVAGMTGGMLLFHAVETALQGLRSGPAA